MNRGWTQRPGPLVYVQRAAQSAAGLLQERMSISGVDEGTGSAQFSMRCRLTARLPAPLAYKWVSLLLKVLAPGCLSTRETRPKILRPFCGQGGRHVGARLQDS